MRMGLGLALSLASTNSAPQPFNPSTVDASLQNWLTGRLGFTPSQWSDQSGVGTNYSQSTGGNQPSQSGTQNTFAGVLFNGTSSAMNGPLLSSLVAAGAHTALWVVRPVTAASSGTGFNNGAVAGDTNGSTGLYITSSGGNKLLVDGFDGTDKTAAFGVSLSGTYIVTSRHSSGHLFGSINGGAEVETTPANCGNLSTGFTMKLGVSWGGLFGNFYLFEQVWFNTDIGTTKLATLINGYNKMYAVF